jgi:hypothetical protein
MSAPLAALLSVTATVASPRIDLMLMGPGDPLYSVYGHAAIRVVHPDGRDIAYNFGGVNVDVPYFWMNLMRGRIQTYLEITTYSDLLLRYSGEDRTIVGRTLRLEPEQAAEVVKQLEAVYASKDRFYAYHHVLDNCTTRIAKLLDDVLDHTLSAQSHYAVHGTHREWILSRVRGRPLLYVLMDLTGNGMGDHPLTGWLSTFLPDGLERVVDRARVGGEPLVTSKYVDYRSLSFDEPVSWDWPWTKVYILFLAPLIALALWRTRWALFVYGLAAGLLGLFYLALWIGSDYEFLHANWNIVNFPPTHLFLAVVASRKSLWERSSKARDRYQCAHLAAVIILLLLWWSGVITQAIGPMLCLSIPASVALSSIRPWDLGAQARSLVAQLKT